MSAKSSSYNEHDIKNNEKMCRVLSVVYKITTRHSMIDVRKKSDLSKKNRTTGSPGHVQKIWDWPQPAKGCPHSRHRSLFNVPNGFAYYVAQDIRQMSRE